MVFEREIVEDLLAHYSKLTNLKLVGFLINKPMEASFTTMYFTMKQYSSGKFLFISSILDLDQKSLNLQAYLPLTNKTFQSCFGVFQPVPLEIDVLEKLDRNLLGNSISFEGRPDQSALQSLIENLKKMKEDDLMKNPELKRELYYLFKNSFRFDKKQINQIELSYKQRHSNLIELLEAYEKEVEVLKTFHTGPVSN